MSKAGLKRRKATKQKHKAISIKVEKVDALNKTIAHLEEELTKEMGGDKDQMRQELEQLEKANEKLREVNNSLVVSLQDVKNEERDIQHERESELRTISRSIQNKKVELQNIAKGNDTFLMNFDRNMDRLLRTIEQRKTSSKLRQLDLWVPL